MFHNTNQLNNDAQQEENIRNKILLLQGLLTGLQTDIRRIVDQSDLKENEKQNLWQELQDKCQPKLAEISKELQTQNNRLVDIRRGL